MVRASVIVSTYNQPRYLELVLLSLGSQSVKDIEVVIADDGSTSETRELVARMKASGAVKITHVWQEDDGFRKSRILNEAVKVSNGDYLIFNDGDCIAHRHFARGHLGLARPGVFLVGRSPRLSQKVSERIGVEDVRSGRAQRITLDKCADYLFGKTTNLEFGVYLPPDWALSLVQRMKLSLTLVGQNFSCWKSDFVKINGFNEEMVGWGKEDDELAVRFRNAGLKPVSAANRAINFHLWHSKGNRVRALRMKNLEVLKRYEQSGEYRCALGLDRH